MKEKLFKLGEKAPILFGILAFAACRIALHIPTHSFLQGGVLRIVSFFIIVIILWPVFQNQHLKFPGKGWKSSFKLLIIVLLFSFLLGCMLVGIMVISTISPELAKVLNITNEEMPSLRQDWIIQLLYLIIMVIGVGMFEEIVFRRGVFLCLSKQLGSSNKAVIISAILGSILFGYVHVSTSFTTDKFEFACAVMKTLQTGIWGFIMCAAFYDSQNIWPVAVIHALNDFFPLLGVLWDSNPSIGTYAYSSNDPTKAMAALGIYVFSILIYLPSAIKSYKILKEKTV